MKKIRLLTLLGIVLFAGTLAACGNNKETDNNPGDVVVEDITGQNDGVINYNDSLVDLASQCIILEDNIWDTYDNDNSSIEDIQNAINNTINTCTNITEEINKVGDREGDSSLREGVLNVIEKEIAYYTKFSEILPFLEKEELTEEEENAYNTILTEVESLNDELTNANNNLMSLQEEFANNHGFELESPEDNNTIAED